MSAQIQLLPPSLVAERLRAGRAVLVDIREPDEFARRHVKGALSRPLSGFEAAHLKIAADQDVIFTCKSGMRTAGACQRLASAVEGQPLVMEGGLDAWAAAGLPVVENARAPMEIMRQVQIAAGLLVVTGVVLGFAVHPAFFILSGAIGLGLAQAGATGFCGLAKLLVQMPWNRALRP